MIGQRGRCRHPTVHVRRLSKTPKPTLSDDAIRVHDHDIAGRSGRERAVDVRREANVVLAPEVEHLVLARPDAVELANEFLGARVRAGVVADKDRHGVHRVHQHAAQAAHEMLVTLVNGNAYDDIAPLRA